MAKRMILCHLNCFVLFQSALPFMVAGSGSYILNDQSRSVEKMSFIVSDFSLRRRMKSQHPGLPVFLKNLW